MWSHALDLFGSALSDPVQRENLMTAARCLLPTYRRTQAAAQLWDAHSDAMSGRVSRLDAAAFNDPAAGSQGSAPDLLWLPAQGQGLTPVPWHWGVAGAQRCALLMLRHLRREANA